MLDHIPTAPLLTGPTFWIFGGVLIAYALVLLLVGVLAQRKIHNLEDYVVAGRGLHLGLATVTMVATWFGAESLMTTTDEVAANGLSGAMLDPFGIAVCLLIAGLFVARPLWCMGLLTVSDFFRVRYGRTAEFISACILIPSYFGWIAAQYLALATLLEQYFGVPLTVGVLGVAALSTSYSLMGGMWSVTWTDALQGLLIAVGLIILAVEILSELGHGDLMLGCNQLRAGSSPERWTIARSPHASAKVMAALSALVIGALGNLPVQDLMQRISSAKTERIAVHACILSAFVYLTMGLLPILAGLSVHQLITDVPSDGVLTALAQQLLSTPLLLMFLLAVVSTVLSTVVSAVLAPAAVLSQNLIQPLAERWNMMKSDRSKLLSQRLSAIAIVIASVALALSGSGAYELVESAYSLSLVGLFAPFVIGLHWKTAPRSAALTSMITGLGSWGIHSTLGWDYFLQPYSSNFADDTSFGLLSVFPHELGDTLLSTFAFLIIASIPTRNSSET